MEKRDEPDSSGRTPSPLRAVARGLWKSTVHLVLALGWLALFALAGLWTVERSGWATKRIEADLERRFGREILLAGAEWSWGRRELVLHDLSLGPGGRDARISRLALRLGWEEPRGLVVERAEIADATIRLSRELLQSVRGVSPSGERDVPTFGRLLLRSVDVSLETPGGTLALGRIDATVEPRGDDPASILGRLVMAPRAPADEPGELMVVGELSRAGELALRGTGRSLPLDTRFVAAGEGFELLELLDPRARLDVDARAHYVLGRSLLPDLEIRVRTSGASARLPHLAAGSERVTDVALDAHARFDAPESGSPSIFERRSWTGRVHASGRWNELALRAGVELSPRAGEPGDLDVWVDAPRVALGEDVVDLLGRPPLLANELFPWLAPSGEAAVRAALRLDADWRPGMRLAPAVHALVCCFPIGETSAAYHGPFHDGVAKGEGFPLRLTNLRGAVVFAWSPERAYADELGLFGLSGDHGSGTARVECSWHRAPLWMPAPEESGVRTAFWLRAASEKLNIDEQLEQAFAGLHAVLSPESLWERFQPSGGEIGFVAELWSNVAAPRLAANVDVEVRGASARFRRFEVPLEDLAGSVVVAVDGRRPPEGGGFCAGVELRARSAAASQPLAMRGRFQRTVPGTPPIEDVVLEADGIDLASPELQAAAATEAAAIAELARQTGIAGRVSARLRITRERPDAGTVSRLEVLPESGVALEIPEVDFRAVELRGRVLVRLEEHPEGGGEGLASTLVSAAPVSGMLETGSSSLPITLRAEGVPTGAIDLDFYVAGAELGDRELLARAMEAFGGGGADERMPPMLPLSGRVDVHADLSRGAEGSFAGEVYVHPRRIAVGPADAPLLADLEGEIVVSSEGLRAERLAAKIAETPIELSEVALVRDEDGYELTARAGARAVPLDHAHLSRFVPSQDLRAWIDDLKWRGTMDVEESTLGARFGPDGLASVSFRGDLALTDVFVQLGVPVAVRSAAARDVELVYEKGALRLWTRVEQLYAQMDGRRLDDASMLITFVQPRLTIERFYGRFEEGELSSLGSVDGSGGGFLALDLVPPYPFGLSIEMSEVDIGGVLRGLFQSDFANQGRLRGALRINGDTAHLMKLRGQGFVELLDSSLWSIPVFQSLFTQLGFDSTATFDRMATSFSIERGAIHMRNMRAESPLLHLVGSGTLGLDGSLSHDLEVRYGLVDRLGPITALLYKIQRSLVHVKISGNMERPNVVLKGLLPVFFQRDRDVRRLPVPSFSELPARF